MKKFEILDFPQFADERGSLTPLEFENLPFRPERVYLVTGAPGEIRGGHAHAIEQEIFIAASGSVTVVVDDGSGEQKILLDASNRGVWVKKNCWHELHDFSTDAVVLAISSTPYLPGESNYETDKSRFLQSC